MDAPPLTLAGGEARTCTPPQCPSAGCFTSLTVTGLSCATGAKSLAYHHCRTRGRNLAGV
jgi:hypothetical protein